MAKRKVGVEPSDPFDPTRLWGKEKYSLQNMLMRSVRFPAEYVHDGDILWSGYTDRHYEDGRKAAEKYKHINGGFESGQFLSALSEDEFVDYCKIAVGCTEDGVTGARVVRYTNASSGYPCYRIDLYGKGEGNPDVPLGACVTRRCPTYEEMFKRRFGMTIDGY